MVSGKELRRVSSVASLFGNRWTRSRSAEAAASRGSFFHEAALAAELARSPAILTDAAVGPHHLERIQRDPRWSQAAAAEIQTWLDWQEAQGIVTIAAEFIVWDEELGIAGTLDRLAELPSGRLAVIDIKTGQPHYYHLLQQIAYAACLSSLGVPTHLAACIYVGLSPSSYVSWTIPVSPEAFESWRLFARASAPWTSVIDSASYVIGFRPIDGGVDSP